MKKSFLLLAGASVLALGVGLSSASAADFQFDANVEGEGELVWEVDYTESWDTTLRSGSNFNFGGGAGADGEATAHGQWTGVGAVFGEYGYGTGDAYSNTLGGNYAEAEYHSGSGALAAGFAADANFNGDPSKMKFTSIITNGGAGSAETGLTYGVDFAYNQQGLVTYGIDAGLSGSYED